MIRCPASTRAAAIATRILLGAMFALATACADDTRDLPSASGAASGLGSGICIVGSDFKSTSVSLVDTAGARVVASAFLTSGSAVSTVGTALSGDVVVAHGAAPDGRLTLIDRGTGVLTFVDPKTSHVLSQISVSSGFYSNPQDYVQVDAAHAWVSRMGRNPKATAALDDFDEGDDVVAIDLASGRLSGRSDMSAHATLASTLAAPGRMAYDGKILWVPLASLSPDFKSAGTGRIVGIDPQSGAVVYSVDAPASKNCVAAVLLPGSHQVAAVCSGFFGEAAGEQANFSNIVVFDSVNVPAQVDLAVAATDLDGKGPFGKDLALLDASRAVVFSSGDFNAGTPDRIWIVDLQSHKATPIANADGPFRLSGLYADPIRQRIWVGEARHASGDLRVLDLSQGLAQEWPSLRSNPADLGPWTWEGFDAPLALGGPAPSCAGLRAAFGPA